MVFTFLHAEGIISTVPLPVNFPLIPATLAPECLKPGDEIQPFEYNRI
jgi:hypothetical protein